MSALGMARRPSVIALGLWAAACSSETPRTEIMVIIDADSPTQLSTEQLRVEVYGRAAGAGTWETSFQQDFPAASWPRLVGVVPANDRMREIRVVATALDGAGDPLVTDRAITAFVARQTRSLTLYLSEACAGVPCLENQTCTVGTCGDSYVAPDSLPIYAPPRRDGGTTVPDGGMPRDSGPPACLPPTDQLDLLLMIDNSNSMTEEQSSFVEQLPRLIFALTTGDVDGDGVPDFDPVDDIHAGVVTSDMGTGGFMVPTCTWPDFGDDGILRTSGNTAIAGCVATYPPFLAYRMGTPAPIDFATDISCVAQLGTGGCGFEQQLDAVLKAITPASSPIRFAGDTTGHADGVNSEFLRPDSALVVLLLTDEEDCSARDPGVFDPMSATYTGDLNLRCFTYPDEVHPVDRFVDGFLATRADPRRFVYAAITGIPPDLDGEQDEAVILADSRMIEMIDPMAMTRLVPSCNVPGRGLAFPPRRIVSVAAGLESHGTRTVLGSICNANYTAAIDRLLDVIGDSVDGTCAR